MPEKLISLLSIDVIFVVNCVIIVGNRKSFHVGRLVLFFFANIVASVVDCLNVN